MERGENKKSSSLLEREKKRERDQLFSPAARGEKEKGNYNSTSRRRRKREDVLISCVFDNGKRRRERMDSPLRLNEGGKEGECGWKITRAEKKGKGEKGCYSSRGKRGRKMLYYGRKKEENRAFFFIFRGGGEKERGKRVATYRSVIRRGKKGRKGRNWKFKPKKGEGKRERSHNPTYYIKI